MPALYIREQGSTIKRVSERIVVVNKGKEILEIPIADVDSLAVFGSVQITTPALQMLMERGIDVNYFSYA
nr:CRISPR-associated endonuclease Cas1 [Lachnospiraceae bacterium]